MIDEMNVEQYMLTTVDNPFNPHTHYNEWASYDQQLGYHCNAYLARIVMSSDEMSDNDMILANNRAIDEILEFDVLGIYRKIRKSDRIEAIEV